MRKMVVTKHEGLDSDFLSQLFQHVGMFHAYGGYRLEPERFVEELQQQFNVQLAASDMQTYNFMTSDGGTFTLEYQDGDYAY